MENKNLGSIIREKRKALNLTMRELAQKAGIDRTYISKIENHNLIPALDILIKIQSALNVDLTSFFEMNGAEKSLQFHFNQPGNFGKRYNIVIELGNGDTMTINL